MDADGEWVECVHIANDAVRDTSELEPARVAFATTRRSPENRIREHLQGLVRRGDGDRVGPAIQPSPAEIDGSVNTWAKGKP